MRWEIDTLARDLGFVPQDGEKMRVPAAQTAKAGLAWVRDVGLRSLATDLLEHAGSEPRCRCRRAAP
jgi:hypothetical protein